MVKNEDKKAALNRTNLMPLRMMYSERQGAGGEQIRLHHFREVNRM